MMKIETALLIENDPEGFFPSEWHEEARKTIEEKGTEEQKKVMSGGINIARGHLTDSISTNGNISNFFQ